MLATPSPLVPRALLPCIALLAVTALAACGDDGDANDATPANGATTSTNSGTTSTNSGTTSPGDAGEGGADADAGGDDGGDTGGDDAGGADVAPDAPPSDPVEALRAPGPFNVGYTTEELTYTPQGYDAPRTLRIATWYPTADTEGSATRYAGLIPRAGIFTDASVGIDAPAPVMVFSHGNGGIAEQSYFLTEHLAQHGWIVVAVNHTGNTVLDTDPDATPAERLALFDLRPQDVRATLDRITDAPDTDPLAGLYSDDLVLAGHSFGGYTTLAVAGAAFDVDALIATCDLGGPDLCAFYDRVGERLRAGFGDPRVKVAIPMTPVGASIYYDGVADIDVPTLYMTATLDETLPEAQEGDPIWAAADGPDDVRVVLEEGGHFTYSNACDLGVTDDGCGPGFMDDAVAHDLIRAYVMGFSYKHLDGADAYDALLDGSLSLDASVTVLTK